MRKRHILYIGFFVLFFHSFSTFGQQLPIYSQYMMNGFLLNPSLAGNDGYTSINLTAREQWLGISTAPRTHAISVQTRLLKTSYISKSTSVRRKITRPSREGRVGLGGYIFNDKNGIIDRTGFQLTYAYHIPMDDKQLSFGISANAFQFSIDENEIVLFDKDDPYLMEYDKIIFIPDANIGVSFHTPELFVGVSATQLLRSALKLGNQSYTNYRLLRHYFIMGGYKFDVTPEIVIQPSILMKSSDSFRSFQIDLNARVFYRNDYWAGLSYRTNDAMVVMAGVKVSQYYFGYAFDYSLSNIRKYSFGSHEFLIAIKLGDNARRYRWLNRY